MVNDEDVVKILKKRKPTGKDLGRLSFFIDMLITDAKRQGIEIKSIDFARQYLGQHLENLDEEQASTYFSFSGLYNIVHTYNHLGQGYYQQALRCFYRIMLIVGNSPIFEGIKSMEDEFDVENVKDDVSGFMIALKRAFGIDQFFSDVEEKYELGGLVDTYGVSDTLAECVQSYNDVVTRLEERNLPEYSKLLSYLPHISEVDYLPKEQKIKNARRQISNIGVFRNKVISTEFYDAYISED